jgi:hypothetical protein
VDPGVLKHDSAHEPVDQAITVEVHLPTTAYGSTTTACVLIASPPPSYGYVTNTGTETLHQLRS